MSLSPMSMLARASLASSGTQTHVSAMTPRLRAEGPFAARIGTDGPIRNRLLAALLERFVFA